MSRQGAGLGSEAASACYLLPVFFAGHMIKMNGGEAQKRAYLAHHPGADERLLRLAEPEAVPTRRRSPPSARPTATTSSSTGTTLHLRHDVADYIMVVTRTKKEVRYGGVTIFMVEGALPGVTLRKMAKIGSKVTSLQEIFFDDLRVPKTMIMGGPEGLNEGW